MQNISQTSQQDQVLSLADSEKFRAVVKIYKNFDLLPKEGFDSIKFAKQVLEHHNNDLPETNKFLDSVIELNKKSNTSLIGSALFSSLATVACAYTAYQESSENSPTLPERTLAVNSFVGLATASIYHIKGITGSKHEIRRSFDKIKGNGR